jgi:sugar-specific transcriptional regulator TrmB
MELKEALKQLGLNEKEASVYLAVLEIGRGSVPSIAKRAGTKRPTTYLILEELRKKGLVSSIKDTEKAIFTAETPEKLLEEQKKKEEIIRENIPELLAIYNSKKEKPKVRFYEGEENIIKLYDEIFKENNILFYGSIASISPAVYKQVEKYLEVIKIKKLKVREILQADEKSIGFAKKNNSENHQIKIAPKNYLFPTDNMIFGKKVAIITYKFAPMAVVIESNDVIETYKSMFEIIWESIDGAENK